MRWERLFDDLEASVEAEDRAEFEAEVADLARAERAALSLADRLRAHVGSPLRVDLVDGDELRGRVVEVGRDWLALGLPAASALVPLPAVAGVEGLGRAAEPADGAAGPGLRLGLGVALRALARDRAYVRIRVRGGGVVGGTIDRVGADHVDVAVHPAGEPRRASLVTAVRTVPRSALLVVRCDGAG